MSDKVIVTDLKKTFITAKKIPIEAIDRLNFHCSEGEFLCILGPTGCGKTTLLRLIAGLELLNSGSIMIDGEMIQKVSRKTILVFQQYSLFPWRNVIDNVAFGLEVQGVSRNQRYETARYYLNLVGLDDFKYTYPYELSGGMQQRIAIARALAANPEILLMDEPFGALDEYTRHQLQEELLRIWNEERKTVIFVTHNIDEAIFLAQRILVMGRRPGRIIREVGISMKRPRNRIASEFVKYHLLIREIFEKLLNRGNLKKILTVSILITMFANFLYGGHLTWRGPKTIGKGKLILMVSCPYKQTTKSYDWAGEEYKELASDKKITTFGQHLMVGYGVMKNWEAMVHLPLLSKIVGDNSSYGLQDIWLKTRYNLLSGKGKPSVTAVGAVKLPTSDKNASPSLDDQTQDIGLGAMIMTPKFSKVRGHLKLEYWLNGKTESDIDVGDSLEYILKADFLLSKKLYPFLSLLGLNTYQKKDAQGNAVSNSENSSFTLQAGFVWKPSSIKGMVVRPKLKVPLSAKGGKLYDYCVVVDVWYVF